MQNLNLQSEFYPSKAPFTLLRFQMKTEQTLSVLALLSRCSAVKTELFENANEDAWIWKRCVLKTINFQCEHQKRRPLKTLHVPLFKGYSLQWHSHSRLAPSWQQLTKGIVLKQGLTTPFCWSSVDSYRFHSLFIWKWSNVNGQRLHQQMWIDTKTELFERSLKQVGSPNYLISWPSNPKLYFHSFLLKSLTLTVK